MFNNNNNFSNYYYYIFKNILNIYIYILKIYCPNPDVSISPVIFGFQLDLAFVVRHGQKLLSKYNYKGKKEKKERKKEKHLHDCRKTQDMRYEIYEKIDVVLLIKNK